MKCANSAPNHVFGVNAFLGVVKLGLTGEIFVHYYTFGTKYAYYNVM